MGYLQLCELTEKPGGVSKSMQPAVDPVVG